MKKLPKAFPENGKFKNLKIFQKSPIAYMEQVAEQFGSPVDLNLPMGDFVLISDPGQAQHVLADNHKNYHKSRGYKEIARVLGDGLLTAEGETWHLRRKLLQPSFHKTELRKLIPAIWNTGVQYIDGLDEDQTLRLDDEMSGLTLTVLLNSLIKYQDDELVERMRSNIEFGQEFIVNRIRKPFKWPVWVPTKENRRYHAMMADSNRLIQSCIEQRKAVTHEDVDDILSVLMSHFKPDEEFLKIRNELLTFLVAGHETSALGMTWTLHLLAHHPDIQQKVYEEVKAFKQLEDLDLMNFSNLTYVHKVIKEALRFYPPIWNIVRRAIGEDEVGGVKIEIGKQLMVNIRQLHHNPEFWPDPEKFDPERFTNCEEKHKFQYLPFGAGPRFCIGNNFAMYEMVLLLVLFVREFEIHPKSPREIEFNPLLTLRPDQPVNVELVRR